MLDDDDNKLTLLAAELFVIVPRCSYYQHLRNLISSIHLQHHYV